MKTLKTTISLVLTGLLLFLAGIVLSGASPPAARTFVDIAIYGDLRGVPGSITVTGTQTITPTASWYLLNPSTTLTATLSTGGASQGDSLCLIGNVTTSTVLIDTGATGSGGNRTIGNNDVWCGWFDGTTWDENIFNDNS